MKSKLNSLLFFIVYVIPANSVLAQAYVVKDIKSFGAKGNGKTNDSEAFQKAAAYFNDRGGNGKLTISKGIYIIGKQTFTGGQAKKPAYYGEDILHFTRIKNFNIEGKSSASLKYIDSLRFGAFDPDTGEPYEHGKNLFVKYAYSAFVGTCFYFDNCSNISISNLTLDGNNGHMILGGIFGDVGRQNPHYGIFIKNSKNIEVNQLDVHHFGLDGICVSNIASEQEDSITISNSSFQYNSRQGLSWVGGNNMLAKNCKFNNNGKGSFSSPPSAGVDIEAEVGKIRNGTFINCEFVNNAGQGVAADSGDSGDCTFTNCTFWGTTTWSVWVTKPGFTFTSCNIYGSFAHGYDSPDDNKATKFYDCLFEDKPYNGKPPYGNFLIETNGAKRMLFSRCNFISNTKKLCWFNSSAKNTEEKFQLDNCTFTINNANLPDNDFAGLIRGAALKNCTFTFTHPDAKKKRYHIGGYGESKNVDLGDNKTIFKQ
jgi:hypothetical protein